VQESATITETAEDTLTPTITRTVTGTATAAPTATITPTPAFMPRDILYPVEIGGSDMEIFAVKADGSGNINMTNSTSYEFSPLWFPDKNRFIYMSNVSGNSEIYRMDADGANIINLSNNPAVEYPVCISPDGTRIIFNSDRNGNGSALFIMNSDGSGQLQLSSESYSPDYGFAAAAWSPDSGKILFAKLSGGNYEIFSISPDGTGLVNLSNHADHDVMAVYSPSGDKIFFLSQGAANVHLFRMDTDGQNRVQLTSGANYNYWSHRISPAGDKIACEKQDKNLNLYNICVMNIDGTGGQMISNGKYDYNPVWSPAGDKILYQKNETNGDSDLHVMNPDGSGDINLTNTPAVEEWLYYSW
jgi:Tol biopolymer transport system component